MIPNETQLLQRMKESDESAFKELFEHYFHPLFKSVFYKIGQYDLAQDIAQETFFRVWTHRQKIKPELAFFSFIEKISRNLVYDHIKRQDVRRRHRPHVETISKKVPRSPDQDLDHQQLEQRIRQVVISDLPEKCRLIFMLSRVEGMANQEIADSLSISRKTVENQLYKALKILRNKCSDYL